ncbi:DNA-3-methyladenine glycosylase I [Corynebacterium urinipleomorphum]|uniref:DNA-3-methyladenine glycosylase I n=1 Tax=Corynebacterium urinipleomorphum TaxID=1852380 RepID=UPI000B35E571|nr:DNA-3-methyladenine glycosylase I [Corynebacterium urinipleomorphum]
MTTTLIDDTQAFELLTLEVFLPGLSWDLIQKKRDALKDAFCDFDPELVAEFDEDDIEYLMKNPALIRNRRKIEAVVTNAKATVAMRDRRSLSQLINWFLETDPFKDGLALTAYLRPLGFVYIGPKTMEGMIEMIISSSQ